MHRPPTLRLSSASHSSPDRLLPCHQFALCSTLLGYLTLVSNSKLTGTPATPTSHPARPHARSAGWCYDEQSCISRSKGSLGSTNALAESFEFGGVASDDPNTNPLMAGWNHVVYVVAASVPRGRGRVDMLKSGHSTPAAVPFL